MKNSEFLKLHRLELLIPESKKDIAEIILNVLKTKYVIFFAFTQDDSDKINKEWELNVYCATTGFASFFFFMGIEFDKNNILNNGN